MSKGLQLPLSLLLLVLVFIIIAAVMIKGTIEIGQAVGQSGPGGACNLYCIVKDAVQPVPAPAFCGC